MQKFPIGWETKNIEKLEACQTINQLDTEAFNYENFQEQDFLDNNEFCTLVSITSSTYSCLLNNDVIENSKENQLFTTEGQNEINLFLAKSAPAPSKAKNHLAKFRYPRVNPEPNLLVDNRSEQEKLESVLRTLNQILTQDQLDVWNNIAERDLASSEKYSSGIPKLKSCISHEIKQFKLSQNKEKELLKQN